MQIFRNMKKIFTLVAVAAVSLLTAFQAHAQFGIVGGLTSSSTSVEKVESRSISLYHAGFTYKSDLGAGFAIQPSLLYQVKGATLNNISSETTSDDFKLKTGFIEMPVSFQWGPDLLAFRPYVFVEPFIGYALTSTGQGSGTEGEKFEAWLDDAHNHFEYGFGVGGGLEIAQHVQLSVQWFNNLGKVFDSASADAEAKSFAENVKNFKGIKFSLAILF